ncbi:hypothetical protein, partial [Saccharothrix sp. Mg75]|uniref:hypothetical protein n=1 Tax=Saccharothrix sp. Mg75 TaxID=3445357 RepID=UPI003EE920D4
MKRIRTLTLAATAAAALLPVAVGTASATHDPAPVVHSELAYWNSSGRITVNGYYTCYGHDDGAVDALRVTVQQEVLGVVRFVGTYVQFDGPCTGTPQPFSAPVAAENGLFLPAVNAAVRAQLTTDGGRSAE